ncbi:tyrosine-protein phosphatase [Streptomyces indicus]|uniref:Protein tyrosine/serine phosphatase n=1 Tax=Streptomyces indicus TaxID=417292 RepID=A0A1G8W384_9ACTN|nr:tyrosine-protein phosphatase [Streptomyces indicus]SDJ72768.1 Protein tyrosine/serine phosphatase [Streptomyces indicus]
MTTTPSMTPSTATGTSGTGRDLYWDGCHNVRDLGGLGSVARGALVRADGLDKLTAQGWAAAHAHGIRTVIDLREPDEYGTDAAPRPEGITTLRVALDGMAEDAEFWGRWTEDWRWGTPQFFGPFMERFPHRVAAVVEAVAQAAPGGVAFHCAAGRDRTGNIALVLLSLLGAGPEEIAADYVASAANMAALEAATGRPSHQEAIEAAYAEHGSTPHADMAAAARALAAEPYLLAAGVTPADLAAVRARVSG